MKIAQAKLTNIMTQHNQPARRYCNIKLDGEFYSCEHEPL